MFSGTKININGEELIVPSLSLGQLRNGLLEKMREHDQLIADGKFMESVSIRGEIILAALRRNYPDFVETKLLDHLDLSNIGEIWLGVLGMSGFKPGEAEAAPKATSGT